MRGVFITFEGPEGSGKTTQLHLLAPWLAEQGYPVLTTREPGGTPIGEAIRTVLHDPAHREMSPRAEILLYSASRAQHVEQLIRPALEEGRVVLCDRYYDSTYAYQGYGRGLDLEMLRVITAFATAQLVPDLTVYLDIDPEIGLQRRRASGPLNRLDQEALDFHRRVRAGYLALMAQEPQRWVTIPADAPLEVVQDRLRHVVLTWLQRHDAGGHHAPR